MAQNKAVCSACGASGIIETVQSIDAVRQPALKEKALSGELFTWQCPSCGKMNLVKYPLVYHDSASKLILVLTDASVSADGLEEGYTGRIVRSVGDFIEKIKIHDSGLDDVIVEMCKYVTRHELGKDVDLKFVKVEGADQEMIFTYPEKDEMQMLSVGLNVYQDCGGILQRNPQIKEAARGLVTIDPDWLRNFFE